MEGLWYLLLGRELNSEGTKVRREQEDHGWVYPPGVRTDG
jgi:hypothetical protein